MIFTLVIGHGSSVAAAICRHQDAHAHALARESRDPKIAAVSLAEDAAAAEAAKKSSQPANGSIHWLDLLPAASPGVPARLAEPVRLRPAEQPVLASTSIPPLLEPPSA
jgi:hypothetical protein